MILFLFLFFLHVFKFVCLMINNWKCLKVIDCLDKTPHLVNNFLIMLTWYPIRFHGDESVINSLSSRFLCPFVNPAVIQHVKTLKPFHLFMIF